MSALERLLLAAQFAFHSRLGRRAGTALLVTALVAAAVSAMYDHPDVLVLPARAAAATATASTASAASSTTTAKARAKRPTAPGTPGEAAAASRPPRSRFSRRTACPPAACGSWSWQNCGRRTGSTAP